MRTSLLARIAAAVASAAIALLVTGPLAVQLGLASGFAGFRLFLLGSVLGLVALLLGLVALFATRPARGRSGRGLALFAGAAGATIVAGVAIAAGPGLGLPPINDITTDPDDPPRFGDLLLEPANQGRDMRYPESFAEVQRRGYPDLAPIDLAMPTAEAFRAVRDAVQAQGWRIVRADAAGGVIEATDTSRVFGFVDDIVVRVRPQADGSRVDVRSKSRDGRGDLGANAARIRVLADAL